jgi:hypothetical protein
MGRLNANANANANAGLHVAGIAANVRYNSQELARLLRSGEFPAEPSPETKAQYYLDQDTVNRVKFRRYWDAELRASIYLNEFLTYPGHQDWMRTLRETKRPHDHRSIDDMHAELADTKGEQLRRVLEVSDEREERFSEIIDQHDGDGTIKYWLGMLMVDQSSAPATYQLIRVARRVGEVVVMCLKHHYGEARPSQVCSAIVPLIDPPVTPAFPAGHALQARLISLCLAETHPPLVQREMLFDLARRVARNRVVAGLHYELDNEAGEWAAELCFGLLKHGVQFNHLLEAARRERQPEPKGTPRPEVW